ncbi:MAG: hypothetical protein CL489_01070 [Acidobacteria bacterium]|nr:hypothetical protein [Acidobacteriota bacterium]|tara:strand:- start:4302 stop:4511 length:210 start_codon:yes stop_codon:yes gene_type:complete
MALTEAQAAAAKADAKEFLEYSIQVLCLTLGVDTADVSSSYAIPVAESDSSYSAHQAILRQATALEALA